MGVSFASLAIFHTNHGDTGDGLGFSQPSPGPTANSYPNTTRTAAGNQQANRNPPNSSPHKRFCDGLARHAAEETCQASLYSWFYPSLQSLKKKEMLWEITGFI